jgi:hypothetical protein
MKIRINQNDLKQGCIFEFCHTFDNGKKEKIFLKPIMSEFDGKIMLYHVNFVSEWGCYDRLFNTYHDARKWITAQSKNW